MVRLSMYILQVPSFNDLSNPGIAQGALAVVKGRAKKLLSLSRVASFLHARSHPIASSLRLALLSSRTKGLVGSSLAKR